METLTQQRTESIPVAETTWRIDPERSTIGFSIKHMVVATIHGRFGGFNGAIRLEGGRRVEVEAEIEAATIDTGIKMRDQHLRSADFFDVAAYPTISFRSTRVQPVSPREGNRWLVVGNLTIHGVTREVELAVDQTGFPDLWDAADLEFRATATINRKDFGVGVNSALDGNGLVIGDEVKIELSITASKAPIAVR